MTYDDYSVDMTEEPGKKPGLYLAEVVEAKRDRTGDQSKDPGAPMIVLTYRDVADGAHLLKDRLMLRGGGWPMSYGKLISLGLPRDHKGPINEQQFVGRRVWLRTVVNEWRGARNLQVDVKGGGHNGYFAENEPPPDAPTITTKVEPIDPSESPF